MERNPFEVNITIGDIARAVGDLVLDVVRHLPETGYPSSHLQNESAGRTAPLSTQEELFGE